MRGYVKCLWYCQRGTRGFWRGVCDFSSVVLDATGTVVLGRLRRDGVRGYGRISRMAWL